MNVTLFQFSKRENSTARPTGGDTKNGNLRENCSVLSPSISFQIGNPSAYNYAYIPTFGRYYFIRDWTYNGGLWVAEMECDALASWRNQIGASTQYVLRSSAVSDGTIKDTLYPAKSNVQFSAQGVWLWPQNETTYVVACIGGGTNGALTYYALTADSFASLSQYLFDINNFADNIGDAWTPELLETQFNPFQYIASVTIFPFSFGGYSEQIKLGWWTIPVTGNRIGSPLGTTGMGLQQVTIPAHPQASRGSYLNAPPYTTVTIEHPAFGSASVPTELWSTSRTMYMGLFVDLWTGDGEIRISKTNDSNAAPVVMTGKVGAPVQIAQVRQDFVGAAMGAVGAVTGIVGNALSGNVGGAINSVASGVGSMIDSLTPKLSRTGNNGSRASFYYPVMVRTEQAPVVDDDNADRGRPLCSPRVLNTIPGYILCLDGDISLPSTAEENRTVKNYMEGGFFYE